MARYQLSLEPATGSFSLRSRRTFLKAGFTGLANIAAAGPGLARDDRPTRTPGTEGTACVVFFLDGGPSHLDTFDPKPNAPAQIRGEFKPIQTAVPGTQISEHLPRLARLAGHFSLVRSLYHGNSSHAPAEHQMLTGWMGSREGTARAVIENPSLGSVVARLAGPRRPGMPAYVAIPWSFHHAYGGSPFGASSYLGPSHDPLESGHLPRSAIAPFEIPILKLREGISPERLDARRALLDRLGNGELPVKLPPDLQVKDSRLEQALEMLINARVRQAFELAREPSRLREQYGAHEWGQGALLARRLVESGITFVLLQCGLRQDWDTHAANFPKLKSQLLPPLDQAVAALIEDLANRGRLDRTLVLIMGEFGRTPVVNRQGGRDHWASVFSALTAGGGLKGGRVVGSSDKAAAYPAEHGLHARDLLATMYHVLGIDSTTLLHDRQGRPIPVLGSGKPIAELL